MTHNNDKTEGKSDKTGESMPCDCEDEIDVAQHVEVSIELDNIIQAEAMVEAESSRSFIRMRGVAFHEGLNKNNWGLTREGAESVAEQMKGMDVTLNHPDPDALGFSRNMEGGIDGAVVGFVNDASVVEHDDGSWDVVYEADIHRVELFEALESGLWMRDGYGVSIGGSGVPEKVVEQLNEAGEITSVEMWFGSSFQFDHLAIVHKPAYERANITEVVKIEEKTPATSSQLSANEVTFNYGLETQEVQSQQEAFEMSDETEIETNTDEMDSLMSEIENLKADAVLQQAAIEQYEQVESDRAETDRQLLVEKATSMGLKGHDDFSCDVLENVIASWEASRPTFEPAVPATSAPKVVEEEAAPASVVANYLNGEIIETDEVIYEKAFNAWAQAWNRTLSGDERVEGRFMAPNYEDAKNKGLI